MSHEAYQPRALRALSPVRTLKVQMDRYATLLEDPTSNSHMLDGRFTHYPLSANEWITILRMSMLGPTFFYVFSTDVSLHGNYLLAMPKAPTTCSYLLYMEREP